MVQLITNLVPNGSTVRVDRNVATQSYALLANFYLGIFPSNPFNIVEIYE